MQTPHFSALVGVLLSTTVVLLVIVSCMSGRLARVRIESKAQTQFHQQTARYQLPPAYSAKQAVAELPVITSF